MGSPENALIGILEAIELGVDMVEFDVRRTKDGYLRYSNRRDNAAIYAVS